MRSTLILASTMILGACGSAPIRHDPPVEDPVLATRLESELRGFRGVAGVYVRHLPTGRDASVRADEVFPTASLVKLPILLALFQRIERGQVDYAAVLPWHPKRAYSDGDLLAHLESGTNVTIEKLVMLMLTMSDNTASLWLETLAGGGAKINEWLIDNGYVRTRVNSQMGTATNGDGRLVTEAVAGRAEARSRYQWGQSTPRDMAEMLASIRRGSVISRGTSQEMYRTLTRTFLDGSAISQIPPWVQVASKQGAVDKCRSEVCLVNAPSGDYVFCVMTRDQQDTRWAPDNEGDELVRRISRLLYRYYEPGDPWRPSGGAQ